MFLYAHVILVLLDLITASDTVEHSILFVCIISWVFVVQVQTNRKNYGGC